MKVLIFTGVFGMGHYSVAKAVKEEILKDNPCATVIIIDMIEYIFPKISKLIYGTFNFMVRKFSFIYNFFNKIISRRTSTPLKKSVIKKLDLLFEDNDIDMIISTFPVCSQYISMYKKMKNYHTPLYTYITDLGVNEEWICEKTDMYFVGSEKTKKFLIDKNLPKEKIIVSGIPVKQDFKEKNVIKQLNKKKEILVMGGGLGLVPCSIDLLKKISKEEDLVEELLNFRLYTSDIPISVNNQTDPLLNLQVFDSTMRILEIMEEKKVENPIMIITKGYITEKMAKRLSNINLNIIILYTFSGLSEKLENRSEKRQIETMQILSKMNNIQLVNYYRPVIEGLNSDEETIKHVSEIVAKYCKCSIISGIRLNTHLKQVLENANIEIPEKYDPDHKVLLPETYNRIKNILKKKNYPVFKKTSCGISYLLNRPDYNGHSARIYYCNPSCVSYPICIGSSKIGFCDKECPNFNVCREESNNKITANEFQGFLDKINLKGKFQISDHYIKLDGTYWQEEISYLRHISKKNVKADNLLKRVDEFLISQ